MMYRHVIFDLDGTLVDSRADLAAAVNHVRHTLRLPELPLEIVSEFIGEGARVLMARSLGAAHAARLDEALPLFLDFYSQHLLERTQLYGGIDQLLRALQARRITLSVLTNKPAQMSRAILEGLGVLPLFAAVVGGDSLPVRKPEAGGVEYLMNMTHTTRADVLLVGDSAIDLRTARAAAVRFCGVAWGLRPAELRAAGAAMIALPSELIALATAVKRTTKPSNP